MRAFGLADGNCRCLPLQGVPLPSRQQAGRTHDPHGPFHAHTRAYPPRGLIAATARVFQSGNSQAIRLPKEFRLDASEVEIFRRGNELIICPHQDGLARAFVLLGELPEDALPDDRGDDRGDEPPPARSDP